jgi:signal transduction histidine kinase
MTTATVTLADLRSVDLFDDLDDEALAAWLEAAEPFDAAPGDVLAVQGEPSRGLLLLFDGQAEAIRKDEDREEPLGPNQAPTWMGAIGALTEGDLGVEMRALTACRAALVPTARFIELTLATPLVHRRIMRQIGPVMNRLNAIEHTRERLASLGTMAAGLAHELNNPAAAAKRAAAELVEALDTIGATLGAFVEAGIEREEAAELVALHHQAVERADRQEALDTVSAADAEDDMLDLLQDLGVPEPWRLTEPLARAGLDAAWLAEVHRLAGPATVQALRWVAASLTAHGLANELLGSAERMSSLVKAVKTYAYMDRGGLVEADLHEGLDSTLVILGHKLKHCTIAVEREYDRTLPPITMRGSELNQVWTNLLDNAIQAMGGTGTITITTSRDGECAQVDIADDGPGIPPEAQPHVLDPFFTTKSVGNGTGLGLDTARRIVEVGHHGSLWFDSSPAGTTFHVRVPLERPSG